MLIRWSADGVSKLALVLLRHCLPLPHIRDYSRRRQVSLWFSQSAPNAPLDLDLQARCCAASRSSQETKPKEENLILHGKMTNTFILIWQIAQRRRQPHILLPSSKNGEMTGVQEDIRDNAFLSPRCFKSGRGVFDCCVARLAPSLSTVSCWREKSVNDAFGYKLPWAACAQIHPTARPPWW